MTYTVYRATLVVVLTAMVAWTAYDFPTRDFVIMWSVTLGATLVVTIIDFLLWWRRQ